MTPGLYGKMPAHGDFVRRNLSEGFVSTWDRWAQAGLAAARTEHDGGWASAWEAAPSWRFALPAGACGPVPVAGVMVFSADAVGRRFPLVLASGLSEAAASMPASMPAPAPQAPDDLLASILGLPVGPEPGGATPTATVPTPGTVPAIPAAAWFDALEILAWQARDGQRDADALASALAAIGNTPFPAAADEVPERLGWWNRDAAWPVAALPPAAEFHFLLAKGEAP